jgi:hypothetical protein
MWPSNHRDIRKLSLWRVPEILNFVEEVLTGLSGSFQGGCIGSAEFWVLHEDKNFPFFRTPLLLEKCAVIEESLPFRSKFCLQRHILAMDILEVHEFVMGLWLPRLLIF